MALFYLDANLNLKTLAPFLIFLTQSWSCVGLAPQMSWFGLDLDSLLSCECLGPSWFGLDSNTAEAKMISIQVDTCKVDQRRRGEYLTGVFKRQ